jgi:hypothetical protein
MVNVQGGLINPMPEDKDEAWPNLCGGIPRPYLYGGEGAAERWALQRFCVETGRQPSWEDRLRIRQELRK